MSDIVLIGTAFAHGPSAAANRLAIPSDEAPAVLHRMAKQLPGSELVLIATCARTELVACGATQGDVLRAWHRVTGTGAATCLSPGVRLVLECGQAAATHLFRLAAGLESPVLGDAEIGGQVQQAIGLAVRCGTAGPITHLLFRHARMAGRRARRETRIAAGSAGLGASVSRVVTSRRQPGAIVIVGAGAAARSVVDGLGRDDLAPAAILNRTRARAETLAARCGAKAAGLDRLIPELATAGTVIVATGGAEPLVRPPVVEAIRAANRDWNPLVVDLGVPPAVDLDCRLQIVDLAEVRREAVPAIRGTAVVAVNRMVDEAVRAWSEDVARRPISQRPART